MWKTATSALSASLDLDQSKKNRVYILADEDYQRLYPPAAQGPCLPAKSRPTLIEDAAMSTATVTVKEVAAAHLQSTRHLAHERGIDWLAKTAELQRTVSLRRLAEAVTSGVELPSLAKSAAAAALMTGKAAGTISRDGTSMVKERRFGTEAGARWRWRRMHGVPWCLSLLTL